MKILYNIQFVRDAGIEPAALFIDKRCLSIYCLGMNDCIAILFNYTVIGLIQWIRVSKMGYIYFYQAYTW